MANLEFTGERMVPGRVDPDLELEHVSRYHFAARLAAERSVLDLASGAGYGSGILAAASARRVVGLDLALDATAYARREYRSGPAFLAADCLRLPFRRGSFDLVVAFEVLEHVSDPATLLREAARVVRSDGLVVLSTPERDAYSESRQGVPNPFHVHEFAAGELSDLLAETFESCRLFAQTRAEGAFFEPVGGSAQRRADLGEGRAERSAFLLALCGSAAVVERAAGHSYFHPGDLDSIHRRDARIQQLQEEVEERSRWGRRLTAEAEDGARRIRELQDELEERTRWARDLEGRVEQARSQTDHLDRELELLREQAAERSRWAEERKEWIERGARERDEWQARFQGLEDRLDSVARRTDEVESDARKTAGRLGDAQRSFAEALQRETRYVERRVAELGAKQDALAARVACDGERTVWQGESLELQRRELDEIAAALARWRPR
ncbi:MAG: methyltransferase domain-containing protein [Thermoanaerobaculia bacterium]